MTRHLLLPFVLLSAGAALSAAVRGVPSSNAQPPDAAPAPVTEEAFSPSLIGAYRKVIEVEADLLDLSARHGLDVTLTSALCLASPRLDFAAATGSTEGCLETHGQRPARS